MSSREAGLLSFVRYLNNFEAPADPCHLRRRHVPQERTSHFCYFRSFIHHSKILLLPFIHPFFNGLFFSSSPHFRRTKAEFERRAEGGSASPFVLLCHLKHRSFNLEYNESIWGGSSIKHHHHTMIDLTLTFATIIQERLKRLEADKAELKAIVEKVRGWNLDCCTRFFCVESGGLTVWGILVRAACNNAHCSQEAAEKAENERLAKEKERMEKESRVRIFATEALPLSTFTMGRLGLGSINCTIFKQPQLFYISNSFFFGLFLLIRTDSKRRHRRKSV
jgi:hypothetical protein